MRQLARQHLGHPAAGGPAFDLLIEQLVHQQQFVVGPAGGRIVHQHPLHRGGFRRAQLAVEPAVEQGFEARGHADTSASRFRMHSRNALRS